MTWLTRLKAALPYLLWLALGIGWTTASYYVGHGAGSDAANAACGTERTASARDLAAAITRARNAEHQLGEALAQRDATHQKELDDVQAQYTRFVDSVRAGAVRVSVPVRPAACSPAGHAGAPPAAQPAATRAELDPAAAADLAAIARDGDSAIVNLNACIDHYNAVRSAASTLNATPDHAQTQ